MLCAFMPGDGAAQLAASKIPTAGKLILTRSSSASPDPLTRLSLSMLVRGHDTSTPIHNAVCCQTDSSRGPLRADTDASQEYKVIGANSASHANIINKLLPRYRGTSPLGNLQCFESCDNRYRLCTHLRDLVETFETCLPVIYRHYPRDLPSNHQNLGTFV